MISYQIAIESRLNSQIPSISYHRKRRINPLYLKITNLEFPSCWLAGVAWRGRAISFYAYVFVIGDKMYCARYNHTVLMPSIMWWSLQLYPSWGKNLILPKLGDIRSCELGILIVPVEFVRRIVSFVLFNTFYGPAHFYARKLPNAAFVKAWAWHCLAGVFHLIRSLMTLTKSLDA
jgi:hypothetical protein